MDGTTKKSLIVLVVMAINALMIWFAIDLRSFWWLALLVVDAACAGWMAYCIGRSVYASLKKKMDGKEENKVKKPSYRRMAS